MTARTRLTWAAVRDSLWFLPTLFTIAAALLAAVTVRTSALAIVPRALREELLFSGGAEGARGVLTAISGSLITVTGTVFSVTIVALQLAGSQYTPRVLRSFLADRANQWVLGIFIGTFTYSLLILRTVHGAADGVPGFVPAFAVTVAVGLVLLSIGALIFFINHAARSIQINVILERETTATLARLDEVFPERRDPADDAAAHAGGTAVPETLLPGPDVPRAALTAARGGYLQAVHHAAAVSAAERAGVTVRLTRRLGEFVIAGEVVAEAWPATRLDPALERAVCAAIILGEERTPEQDPEFGIIEISDIAVRAMSHAINDPTTALTCIDRLGEILAHLGGRRTPGPPLLGRDGTPRLIPLHTSFDRALGLAFDQLRYFGAGNPAVAKKLIDTIARLRALLPAAHHAALDAHAGAVLRGARYLMENPADFGSVASLAERRLDEVAGDATPVRDGRDPAPGGRA